MAANDDREPDADEPQGSGKAPTSRDGAPRVAGRFRLQLFEEGADGHDTIVLGRRWSMSH